MGLQHRERLASRNAPPRDDFYPLGKIASPCIGKFSPQFAVHLKTCVA